MYLSVKGSSAAPDELTCCLPTVKATPTLKWKSCWVRPTRATSYAASNSGTSKGDAPQRTIMSPFLSLRILRVAFST